MPFDAAVARAAVLACELEVAAEKPGNVTPRHAFAEMTRADFLASARAVGPVMGEAGGRRVGETVLAAVEATRRVAPANTNLGIVLLLAPLAKAAAEGSVTAEGLARSAGPAQRLRTLRYGSRRVLAGLDVEDARLAYRAIRLARPGGMGHAETQDLAEEPTVTLLETMCLAAHRDAVAGEYAGGFGVTFDVAQPFLADALSTGMPVEQAVVDAFLAVLARVPDTLIARQHGYAAARQASERAREVSAAGPPGSVARARAVADFDAWLRDPPRAWNPGTTADLLTAALFVHVLAVGEAAVVAGAAAAGTRDAR